MTRATGPFEVKLTGTGELAGLAGTLAIAIAHDGRHSYDFEYAIV